jgi:DNA-directed RNA polymerase subunit M/transcription elongation factor TFIIS
MRFCSECQNMYYIRINSDNPNQLIHYCRNCGTEEAVTDSTSISISKISAKNTDHNFSHIINKYTKLDPTLPRINNIACVNSECATNHEDSKPEEREIIYIRYDEVNMKYVYLCSTCDAVWKTDEQG